MARLLALFVLVSSQLAFAQGQDDALVEVPITQTDAGYGFLLYTPPGYSQQQGRTASLVLFLHGAGEQGAGQGAELWTEMIRHGAAKLLVRNATTIITDAGLHEARGGSRIFADENAIVVVPQSPEWWNTTNINHLMTWVNRNYRINPRRIYVTGISMGGGGTWSYVSGQGRERIASAVPICGAAGPGSGSRFLKTPIWAFHAWGDGTVNRSESIGWVSNIGDAYAGMDIPSVLTGYPHRDGGVDAPALTTMTALYDNGAFDWTTGSVADGGAPVRLTLYTDSSHDSWSRTYDNNAMWEWLFRHRSQVHPDFEDALVVDDLDEGFSVDGGWVRLQPNQGGFYGWEELEAPVSSNPSARFEGTVPMAGVYRFSASAIGGSNRTVTRVVFDSAAGQQTFLWDQRDGGTRRLGEVEVAGNFVVTFASTAMSGTLTADAIALGYLRPLDGGVIFVDAGTTIDAGTPIDAGSTIDAGSAIDAGTTTDAGSGDDAGTTIDAGFNDDAGTTIDAGTNDDAGSSDDAGMGDVDSGVGEQPSGVAGGCGCSSFSGEFAWLAILAIGLVRRRR